MNKTAPLILVIEDDPQTRRLLKTNLGNRGWQVLEAEDGKTGIAHTKTAHPDLVILDLGLPDIDGISVTKRLRQLADLPILVLSARSQEQNKIMALDAGADDYLTKPFSIGELHARLQALLRRVNRAAGCLAIFQAGELQVDLTRRKVFLGATEVHITPIEYRLLSILIRHAGLVVTHRQLLLEVWGAEHINDQHYLRIYMGQLRHKLEANPARPRYLLTEVGVGYRLADDGNEDGG
ncbi:response regulator [Methylovulum psychrotolerans]|uniref:DNA-binding response regulator n=1 Tax=Methylovulum psychrotolerans TaxID=1704499 RepID=A0A1Z4C100_9GAMM|nr:response regulator [Methylovulum psychrotolerans]ASF47204.1 DNA-binding response regulator [Methylovulum psychrotolerans]MBT9099666.1 response regulator [Methylovulum psychrotolerans]POZ50451.1 DNA-binding response regulator [Methylovulum psychrotolerans]